MNSLLEKHKKHREGPACYCLEMFCAVLFFGQIYQNIYVLCYTPVDIRLYMVDL